MEKKRKEVTEEVLEETADTLEEEAASGGGDPIVAEPVPEGSCEQDDWQQKYTELNDKYLRLLAEYDNYRKRSQKERDDIYPTATAAAVVKFLPVLDNFERAAAFEHADDEFGKGFDMIYQSFREVLDSLGVETAGEVGESFNPDLHNAVMHIEDEALSENVISQVLQKGYRIGDRIIRYAMVQTAN